MRNPLRALAFCITLLIVAFPAAPALGEKKYVSIQEIRETLPERWRGEYAIKKGDGKNIKDGDAVSIDVPIVVPDVDSVPVVRITWEPPVEGMDVSLEVERNEWGLKAISRNFFKPDLRFPLMEENVTFEPSLPWEEAPAIAIDEFRKWMPFMRDKELTCYYQRSYGDADDNGYQCVYFYTTYHGIPQLRGGSTFSHGLESEYGSHIEERMAVPATMVLMRIKQPGQFWTNIYTSKEIGVEVEDIPLLPFEDILKVLEQQVTDGRAYMLNEVRFGYMGFIDPENNGEEFLLMPVWAAKGRTRSDLKLPFDLKTDQAVLDRGGYGSHEVIMVNAQTGQVYDFAHDIRPNRLHVPHIITWDEVK